MSDSAPTEPLSRPRPLRVDFIAPPFAGHLFPLLDLICGYSGQAQTSHDEYLFQPRILTTKQAEASVAKAGLPMIPLLTGHEERVAAIADKDFQINGNPFAMIRQFQDNLALMPVLRDELLELWKTDPPDVVVADFVVPIAGYAARSLGIPWWTTLATPFAIESKNSTPCYVGGWLPDPSIRGRIRDWCGRTLVRLFKRGAFWAGRKQLKEIGVDRIYRSDGSEMIYSDERIYAFGVRELEWRDEWPVHLKFLGPLPGSPRFDHPPPTFRDGRKQVLVSLGTHLPWAKKRMLPFMNEVAIRLPNIDFHFTLGSTAEESELQGAKTAENLTCYRYLTYDLFLKQFDAAITHAGTGVLYSCLQHAVPQLVWPQDYDQFDFAARAVHAGVAIRCRETVNSVVADLPRVISDFAIAAQCDRFRTILAEYSPQETFRRDLREFQSKRFRTALPE